MHQNIINRMKGPISRGQGSKRACKIVILGEQKVGKTSIIHRYTSNRFNLDEKPTIGVDFMGKNVEHEGVAYRLQLWDTSGNERFASLIPNYLSNAYCALVVYDRTNLESLENIEKWIQLFKQSCKDKASLAVVENKIDLESFDKTASASDLERFKNAKKTLELLKKKYNLRSFSVSALDGQNINEMFLEILNVPAKDTPALRQPVEVVNTNFPMHSSDNFVIDEMQDPPPLRSPSEESTRSADRRRRRKRPESVRAVSISETESLPQTGGGGQSWWGKVCPCLSRRKKK